MRTWILGHKRETQAGALWLGITIVLLAVAAPACAADPNPGWPILLGPRRNGIAQETGLNLNWKEKAPRVLWKVPVGGGFSSMVVVDGRLWTLANRGDKDVAACLDSASGKELWVRELAPRYLDNQGHGPGPRSTPTYHKGRLYCLLPLGELFCLEAADGKEVWKTNILEATGTKSRKDEYRWWGLSLSPLVDGDLVIVQPGGNKDNSVAAFHKDTGKLVWSAGSDPSGYSSPIVITAAGRRHVVCPTGKSILGIDPTKGKVLWRYPFGNQFDATAATPLWVNNLLFVSAAYGTGSAALEIVADGDRLKVQEKWRNARSLQNLMATSIILDGHIYGCSGDIGVRFLRCVDLATGEVKWQERLAQYLSFVAADGHLICLGSDGSLHLIEANPEKFVPRGETDVLAPKAWAYPVLLNKKLYIRDEKHLACVDLSRE